MSDSELIIQHYFKGFKNIFPNTTQHELSEIISDNFLGGWEEAGHRHAGGRRELKMLYATILLQKPQNILEIGTYKGDSTNHILLAGYKSNETPNITTVDINDYNPIFNPLFLDHYNDKFTISLKGSNELLRTGNYDFIFQDGNHSANAVRAEIELFRKMDSLKMIFAHDCYLYPYIQDIYKRSGIFKQIVTFKEPAYKAGFLIAVK